MLKQETRVWVGLVLVVLALPAGAATIVKERNTTEGSNGNTQMVAEITVDADKMKMAFLESNNPMLTAGSYMLKQGGTIFLVYPDKKTYMRMETAEFDSMSGVADAADAKRNEEAERRGYKRDQSTLKDFSFKTLADEPGPTLLSYPTHHYKYELKYKVAQTMAGSDVTMQRSVDRIEEFWATTAVDPAGAGGSAAAMAAMGGRQRGDAAFPEVAEAEKTMQAKGFRLKEISQSKEASGMGGMMGMMTRFAGGSANNDSKITTEVLELRTAAVTPNTFTVPTGYAETTMMGPSNMPNLNQMPGMPPGSNGGMPDLNDVPNN
jgi:hypothetical protein